MPPPHLVRAWKNSSRGCCSGIFYLLCSAELSGEYHAHACAERVRRLARTAHNNNSPHIAPSYQFSWKTSKTGGARARHPPPPSPASSYAYHNTARLPAVNYPTMAQRRGTRSTRLACVTVAAAPSRGSAVYAQRTLDIPLLTKYRRHSPASPSSDNLFPGLRHDWTFYYNSLHQNHRGVRSIRCVPRAPA